MQEAQDLGAGCHQLVAPLPLYLERATNALQWTGDRDTCWVCEREGGIRSYKGSGVIKEQGEIMRL